MNARSFVLAAVLLVAGAVAGAQTETKQASAPQEPITIYKDEVLTEPQPKDVMDRVAQVDAVVRCRIDKSEVTVFADSNPPPGLDPLLATDVMTEHAVTVLEVIKRAQEVPSVRSPLVVLQQAGAATVKGRLIQNPPGVFPPFVRGEEYVLFLNWNARLDHYVVAASDAFLISGESISTPGHKQYAAHEASASASEFLGRLRAAAWIHQGSSRR
jgi:hypothetical protein